MSLTTPQRLARALPFVGKRLKMLDDCGYTPGHYYSPIPNLAEIELKQDRIFGQHPSSLHGIDLRKAQQLELLNDFATLYAEIPFDFFARNEKGLRYQAPGAWYRYSDVVFLYSILRRFRPQRIVEVGSGFSSAVMMDVNDLFLDGRTELTFIEPFPDRLNQMLRPADRQKCAVVKDFIQNVDLSIFRQLDANDVLFIDTSHVSKVGSDVNHLIFEILPVLRPGVLIHFHDIFYPFEMPREWVLATKLFWNENYLLRAFLTGNKEYEIVAFNSFLHKEYEDWFKERMPVCLTDTDNTGSIWLRKV
jgi:predicted O-methyltransferase YrrM